MGKRTLQINLLRARSQLAMGWLALWFFAALVRFWIIPQHRLSDTLVAPGLKHIFGADIFGRDLLEISLRASLSSAAFGAAAAALAIISGLLLGTWMALAPRWIRFPLLRGFELLLAFPSLLLALTWAAIRGPGWDTLLFSLLIGTVPSFTRLIYARTLECLQEDYILAARSLGAGSLRILGKHLIPNASALCKVKAPNLFAHALLAEATLSFLGIGAPLGRDTWGSLLAQGREYLIEAPHIAMATGIPLVLTILALQWLTEE